MSYESHKELGYDIMLALQDVFVNSILVDVNSEEGCYQKLKLEGGCSIRYTKWRQDPLPFYVVLYNKKGKFIFEMDLSMVICNDDFYQWHFKAPSNKTTLSALEKNLGKNTKFTDAYSSSVKNQKELLNAGKNTPRNGYRFLENADWNSLCKKLTQLIVSVFKEHNEEVKKTKRININEASDDNGDYAAQLKRIRRGQRKLRQNLLLQYENKCAITGYAPTEVLEAAHIVNHSIEGVNHSDNGILLRADIHSLFDSNLLKIHPDTMKVIVSEELQATPYWQLNGKKIRKRVDGTYPDSKYFKGRWVSLEN